MPTPPVKVTVPVPHPGAVINQPLLNDLRTRGMFLGQNVYASLLSHGTANGIPGAPGNPSSAARPKYFTSYSNLGIFIDGSLVLDGPFSSAFSDDSFKIYSKTLSDFYRERIIAKDYAEFGTIPRLVIRELPEPGLLNFSLDIGKPEDQLENRTVSTAEQPWAFGSLLVDPGGPIERDGVKYRAMFPSNHGLKFENGLPVVFDYQQYNKAFPIINTPSVGTGGGTKTGAVAVKSGINLRTNLFPLMMQPTMTDAEFEKAVIAFMEVK